VAPQPTPDELGVSKGAIDRAGDQLRSWSVSIETEDTRFGFPAEAADVLFRFRAQFPDPLKKVTVGVRQFV
jgi:hypothetical protein